jgi:hypothetical protein
MTTEGPKVEIRVELPLEWCELVCVLDEQRDGTLRERVSRVLERLCDFAAIAVQEPSRKRWFEGDARHFTGRALLLALFGPSWLDRVESDPKRPGFWVPCLDGLHLEEGVGARELAAAAVEQMVRSRCEREHAVALGAGPATPVIAEEQEIGLVYAALQVHPWHAGVVLTPEAAEAITGVVCDLEVERRVQRELLGERVLLVNGRAVVEAPPAPPEEELLGGRVGAEDVERLALRMFEIVMLREPPAGPEFVTRERWHAAARIALESAHAARSGR